jgi:hypothetical protein
MTRKLRKLKFRKWLLAPGLALLTFCLTEIGSRNPTFVEMVYAKKMYPFIASVLSFFSNTLPFSMDDVLYLLLILTVLLLVLLLILGRISFGFSGKIMLNILAVFYILFYTFWGFNYFREELSLRLGIQNSEANVEEFITVFEKLIEDTNNSYSSFNDLSKKKIDKLVEESYQDMASILQIKYPAGKRKDKSITFSSFFAKTGISGYYGPFFNEVHVNKKVTELEYPVVLAHEKAHQFGITSEAEANFYAWLVCANSHSAQLKYSGNLFILKYFLYHGFQLEQYPELVSKIDQRVKDDINSIRKHWMELRNERMDKAASRINDAYLKTNKVEEGIKDYRGVVRHVMNFSLDSTFQKRHNLLTN